ncbi:MAG: hypothetical protein ACM3ZV_06390 [Bacillota bacterium]
MANDSQPAEKHPIHGYVCADVHGRFEAYRREIGLTSGSALLTLLVLRELNIQRLGASPPSRPRDGAAPMPRESKVSAYIDADKVTEFKALSDTLGRSTSDCAADLITRELEERWLETVLKTGPAEGAGS